MKMTFRALRIRKAYALVKVTSLAVGFCVFLMISFYLYLEMNFDCHHPNAERIYRVGTDITSHRSTDQVSWASGFLAGLLKDEYSDVEETCRLTRLEGKQLFTNRDDSFFEGEIFSADNSVFAVFSYQFIEGKWQTALDKPGKVVLTKSLSDKLFNGSGLDKMISINGKEYLVSGVIADLPYQSNLNFKALLSYTEEERSGIPWAITYILFRNVSEAKEFGTKLDAIAEDKFADLLVENPDIKIKFVLEPLVDLHLTPPRVFDEGKGSKTTIYIFIFLAIFMLVIPTINYINLSLLESGTRSKEIGVKLVMGAQRRQLFWQFMTEAIVFVVISLLLACVLCLTMLPEFRIIIGRPITVEWIFSSGILNMIGIAMLLIAFTIGLYPAIYLASMQPINVIKAAKGNRKLDIFNQATLVLQLAITVGVVASTMIVSRQFSLTSESNLGFDRKDVIIVDFPDGFAKPSTLKAFADALSQQPGIKSVSLAGLNSVPNNNVDVDAFFVETKDGDMVLRLLKNINIDEYYLETLHIDLVQGESFTDAEANKRNYLVNETFVKAMGWIEPLGMIVQMPNGPEGKVIGVIKDFHIKSLHHVIEPLLLEYHGDESRQGLIRIDAQSREQGMKSIKEKWVTFFNSAPVNNYLLSDYFDRQYEQEQLVKSSFSYLTIIILVVCALGLYVISSYTATLKIREMAIRKVMGASNLTLFKEFSRRYIILSVIATGIAVPVSAVFLQKWLNSFVYKIDIDLVSYLLAFGVTIAVVMFAIAYHFRKLTTINPAAILRQSL
ncbi:MAG: ABC transporter permease [Bacteroidota bacterium]